MKVFNVQQLKDLYRPDGDTSNEENGQVTIIGGSRLFHGAPILSLKVASRIVDMVFFASPEKSVGYVAEQIKSKLLSFIWVPWEEVDEYIEKSDAVLIGPGMMRYGRETGNAIRKTKYEKRDTKEEKRITYPISRITELDDEGRQTRQITKRLLMKYPNKRWVIDAGSLQVMEAGWIPKGAIITPNRKEFEMLFGDEIPRLRSEKQNSAQDDKADQRIVSASSNVKKMAEKYKCTIVLKGPETIICFPGECTIVKGGNAGLTKGGTGDVLAGLTVALFAKNKAHLAACAASYIEKKAADELYEKVGSNFSADDLANKIPETLASFSK